MSITFKSLSESTKQAVLTTLLVLVLFVGILLASSREKSTQEAPAEGNSSSEEQRQEVTGYTWRFKLEGQELAEASARAQVAQDLIYAETQKRGQVLKAATPQQDIVVGYIECTGVIPCRNQFNDILGVYEPSDFIPLGGYDPYVLRRKSESDIRFGYYLYTYQLLYKMWPYLSYEELEKLHNALEEKHTVGIDRYFTTTNFSLRKLFTQEGVMGFKCNENVCVDTNTYS